MPRQGSANGSMSFHAGPCVRKAVDFESYSYIKTQLFLHVKILWQRFTGIMLECSFGIDVYLKIRGFSL